MLGDPSSHCENGNGTTGDSNFGQNNLTRGQVDGLMHVEGAVGLCEMDGAAADCSHVGPAESSQEGQSANLEEEGRQMVPTIAQNVQGAGPPISGSPVPTAEPAPAAAPSLAVIAKAGPKQAAPGYLSLWVALQGVSAAARRDLEGQLGDFLIRHLTGGLLEEKQLLVWAHMIFAKEKNASDGSLVKRYVLNVQMPSALEGKLWSALGGCAGGCSILAVLGGRGTRIWRDQWRACLEAAGRLDLAISENVGAEVPAWARPRSQLDFEEGQRYFSNRRKSFSPEALEWQLEMAQQNANIWAPQQGRNHRAILRRAAGPGVAHGDAPVPAPGGRQAGSSDGARWRAGNSGAQQSEGAARSGEGWRWRRGGASNGAADRDGSRPNFLVESMREDISNIVAASTRLLRKLEGINQRESVAVTDELRAEHEELRAALAKTERDLTTERERTAKERASRLEATKLSMREVERERRARLLAEAARAGLDSRLTQAEKACAVLQNEIAELREQAASTAGSKRKLPPADDSAEFSMDESLSASESDDSAASVTPSRTGASKDEGSDSEVAQEREEVHEAQRKAGSPQGRLTRSKAYRARDDTASGSDSGESRLRAEGVSRTGQSSGGLSPLSVVHEGQRRSRQAEAQARLVEARRDEGVVGGRKLLRLGTTNESGDKSKGKAKKVNGAAAPLRPGTPRC